MQKASTYLSVLSDAKRIAFRRKNPSIYYSMLRSTIQDSIGLEGIANISGIKKYKIGRWLSNVDNVKFKHLFLIEAALYDYLIELDKQQ